MQKTDACVACHAPMWATPDAASVRCCHPCRRSLTDDQKAALGVVSAGRGKYRGPRKSGVKFPTCPQCGELFCVSVLRPRKYCTKECAAAANPVDVYRNQRNMARKRARKRAAFVEDVDPLTLFERDGWRCYLCGKRCPRDAQMPNPLAPTIDHVVPLAAGGEHSYRNTATAHLRCNVSKGARNVGQQLALVG